MYLTYLNESSLLYLVNKCVQFIEELKKIKFLTSKNDQGCVKSLI